MKKIDKILACIDLSDYSAMVLEYARELAQRSHADLLVLNVVNQKDVNAMERVLTDYPQEKTIRELIQETIDNRYSRLRALVKAYFPESSSSIALRVDIGNPFETILNTSEDENIDLIVIANKGRGNLSRLFLGSVAEKVIRHSKVPVVSVRDREKFKRSG